MLYYSAAYDAAGEMTCRALGSSSCTATPATGQSLSYDALRRLASWQNGSSSSEQYAYDGEGTRVWRQTTSGSTTTTTVSILGVEDVTLVSGGATTATRYYRLPGGVTATRDSSGLVYEATDALGTPIAALNLASGITGEQLRAPYGQARYAASGTGSSGGMRTPYGFTGQREDTTPSGASGLDDFHARMYDAETGRFTSADDAQPGLGDPGGQDGYAYVGGMVEQATDPSGHAVAMRLETQAGDALAIVGAAAAVVAAIYLADWLNTHRDDLAVNQGILNASAASAAAAAGAGTLPTATAVTVRQGSNVSITLAPDGTITVTTTIPGSAYGGTSTVYAPGQPGYLDYIHAFDAPTTAGDLPLNQATDRPTASANTVTGSSSSVAGAGTTAGAGAVGTPPSTIQPGVPSAAASALATTVATAGTLVGTWYAFAKQSKGGSNTAANKRARQVAKEFGCDPDTDPECYEDFMDALHNYKGKSGRGGADHWPIERLRAFAREYFESDPDAWQIYDP